ncbi:MAG: MerR family transcriptional regulator [Chloroflexi bacterium]|nr:MerR family transcriptional regulator [Chloroflexota bacterium]
MVQDLTIEDLAQQSGLSLRTLRYYIQEGLLPGPDTAGKYASYSQQHLDHLAMITRLKNMHLPLKEIRHLLSNMSVEDMRRILDYQDAIQLNIQDENVFPKQVSPIPGEKTSALEYIRDLEQRQTGLRSVAGSPSIPAAPQVYQNQSENYPLKGPAKTYQPNKERWTKVVLGDGIELNIREEIARRFRGEIDELIRMAADLLSGKENGGSKNE